MAIIFDLDGTLIDSLPLHKWALEKAVREVLGAVPGLRRFIMRRIRLPAPMLFDMISEQFDIHIDEKTRRRIMIVKRKFLTIRKIRGVSIFNNAKNLLLFLKRNGIKYCIATSMNSAELRLFGKALRLGELSSIIINPDKRAHEKPDPYIINKALAMLHSKRKDSFYVGDSPYDYVASERAGVGFMGVYNKDDLKKYGNFFDNLRELDRYLHKNLAHFRE